MGAWRIEGRPDAWWAGLPFFFGKSQRLPCGSGCYGFGSVGELRTTPSCCIRPERPVDKAFRYLAVRDASDGHPGDGDVLPGWSNAIEVTFMGARQDQRVMTVSPSAMTSSIVK